MERILAKAIGILAAALAIEGTANAQPAGRATILFFNDAHQLAPVRDRFGDRGGVARLATLVREVRREQPATLVLFGGDLAGGTLFGGQFRGAPQVEAFNRLGVDLASFGQHDFDFGSAHARELVAASHFPWITTNLDADTGAAAAGPVPPAFAGLLRGATKEIGGLRVAFLGLTDDMDSTTRDDQVRQRDLVAAARAEVGFLMSGTVRPDAIVAMAQTGTAVAEQLLREIPQLSAVLAEEQAEDRTVTIWIGGRPIVAPAGNMGSVARLDFARGRNGVEIAVRALPVDASIAEDAGLAAFAREYDARLDQALAEAVGENAASLSADGARSRESALGNLVADAFRAACAAQIGLVSGGSLRADLPAGRLRRKELAAVLPFGNHVVCVDLSGHDLRALLEHGAAGIEAGKGTLLQVSGLRYTVDLARPTGARVTGVAVAGAALASDAMYRVALSSFVAGGGDGFARVTSRTRDAGLDVDALSAEVRRAHPPSSAAARLVIEGGS